MRVGFFTYGMADKLTGIGRYTAALTRALQALDMGVEPVLLSPYPESTLPWYDEFETHHVPSLRLVPAAASLGNWVLHRAATDLSLDILHDPCGIAPFLAPSLSPTRRYKRVVTVHDAIPLVTPAVQPLMTRAIFRTLIPAARLTADAVLTVSEASARDLAHYARIPREKLFVTPNGVTPPATLSEVEVEEILARLRLERPYFLYVGNLTPRKNLSRVLGAFARLRSESVAAPPSLVIVGPSAWRAHETMRRAREVDGVVLTGYVDDATLSALYRGAAALVFPSLYEGFGLPALEAMCCGAPVISSATSALPEVIGDAGLLVEPTDEVAIYEAMRTLLERPDLAQRLRQRGYERSACFTWERTARTTCAVYETLLGGRR